MSKRKNRLQNSYYARDAVPMDVASLTSLCSEFFEEAGWQQFTEFDEEKSNGHFSYTLEQPLEHTGCFIIMLDDYKNSCPVGFIKCIIQDGVCKDRLGVLDAVYVKPEHRLSAAGRILFQTAEYKLKAYGCAAFFASPGAMMGQVDKSMANMLRKLSFEHKSVSLTKVFKEL